MTHRTMSERSYHGATSCSPQELGVHNHKHRPSWIMAKAIGPETGEYRVCTLVKRWT